MKIQIRHRHINEVLHEIEGDNVTIRDCVVDAISNGASLRYADLRYASLRYADLSYADLSYADLRSADLRYADLRYADLRSARLRSASLQDANLQDANLYGANLSGANLRGANLRSARLRSASLQDADLQDANLRSANLRYADLRSANLQDANLRGANLRYARLRSASLQDANLYDADLYDADLQDAKNVPYIRLSCPSDGAFVGWKIIKGYLVKLEVQEDARRSSATTSKCRCDKAKVLGITSIADGSTIDSIVNDRYSLCEYVVGEMVYPDSFDENRWNECSHGIHFFINREEAVNYE